MHLANPLRPYEIKDFPNVYESMTEAPTYSSLTGDQDSGVHNNEHLPKRSTDIEMRPAGTTVLSDLRQKIFDTETAEHSSQYNRQAKIVNLAINNISKGRFQRCLWLLCGFGWFADNLWLQGVALTLPQVSIEFGQSESSTRYATMSLFAGLCVGASFWGIASDKIGRRPAFNCTLFIAGLFGLLSGFAESFEAVCALYACVGVGVGGNLPVDGAFLLEFLPAAEGHWLTLLSICWPIGQLVASGIAWGFTSEFSCPAQLRLCSITQDHEPCCPKEQNAGWRYLLFALGSLTLVLSAARSYFLGRIESPKYLLSRDKQSEAVAMVYRVASSNGRKTWLSVDLLLQHPSSNSTEDDANIRSQPPGPSFLSNFSTKQVRPLFGSGRLAWSTTLIWFMWLTIGMGYPLFNSFLPQYLANSGQDDGASSSPDTVYRNYFITSAVGVPGSILACQTVKIPGIGRKYTMAVATAAAGMLLIGFAFTQDQASQIAVASLEAFFQNIAYGVMYAYTPEVFPAPNRGTGSGFASFLNRLGGLCAPLIAIHVGQVNPSAPIYTVGGLFMITFVAMCALPIETMGRETL